MVRLESINGFGNRLSLTEEQVTMRWSSSPHPLASCHVRQAPTRPPRRSSVLLGSLGYGRLECGNHLMDFGEDIMLAGDQGRLAREVVRPHRLPRPPV